MRLSGLFFAYQIKSVCSTFVRELRNFQLCIIMYSDTDNHSIERGFLLHVFHRQNKDRDILYAVGKLECGETFGLMDTRWRPFFYCRVSDREVVQGRVGVHRAVLVESSFKTIDSEPVLRVECPRVSDLRRLERHLEQDGIRTYEADLNFGLHCLMEAGIRGVVRIEGTWQAGKGVDRVYADPQLAPDDFEPDLALLVLDIETAPDASEVYAVSLVGSGPAAQHRVEEIHLVGAPAAGDPDQLCCHADERSLLEALAGRVRSIDPDILSGWNIIDFDLKVLQTRFEAHELDFNLGRTQDASWYRESKIWGGSRMVIYGRQILDALHLVRATMQTYDDWRLGTVARAVLGRGKTLEPEDDETMPEAIVHAYEQDRAAFCAYCLEDSRLVWDILEKEGLIALTLRRSRLIGLPLERAWGSVAAFDFMYISALRRRGTVAPTTGVDRREGRGAPGGLVIEPQAGLYHHLFVFDFKSLYPSIMRTFNIDPWSYAWAGAEAIEAPNGARFDRAPGILPEMLEEFWKQREEAKTRGDAVASHAYKIIMNSFYGVLASGSCRFAAAEMAGAITEFGHYILRWAQERLEDQGVRVIYGDTDSVFVDPGLGEEVSADQARILGAQLCAEADQALARHIGEEYGVESRLELEFEKYYLRFLLPPMRGSEKGRAKGYAGLRVVAGEERLEIVGMEAVRRDWTRLAHQLQRQLLDLLFHDAESEAIEACAVEWVRALRAGEKDADLVYRKSLRKPVADYIRNVPPHVQAARLLPRPRGVIQYVVTCDGPQPVGRLSTPPDYEHYARKQIEPILRTIAQICPIDVESVMKGAASLFGAEVWAGLKRKTQ